MSSGTRDRPTDPISRPAAPIPAGEEGTLPSGTILGSRYRITGVLGFGGMGLVYRALDLKLDQEIALKRLRPERVSPDKRELLRREIILSRKVTHENVCRIYDLEEIDGVEYVSMEYIRGTALKDIEEEEGVLPLGRGLSIAKGLCRGLAAAHRIGVLHRDLKPENVLVDERGVPRLMDFGIAIDRTQPLREKSGTVPGTPQFLAPELLRGAAPDARSDLYALGVLLFEMFTGRVPFDDPDTKVLVRKILENEAPRVGQIRPDLPPELAGILHRAIAKDPEARFSSAEELLVAIERYEGMFLDRVLREVDVARARSVKLMVILEANKALASAEDPTETLRIILRTATQETDAERGTIFLVEPGTRELVSQILEGGQVAPIRLAWGQGIAGICAAQGRPIAAVDAATDPRHERGPDSTSGFKTRSLLAVPMKIPSGEVVGVIELLNKRRRAFGKEDEEFLSTVADHAALAVWNSLQREAALKEASRESRARILAGLRPLLSPRSWPETPGFDSAPLRWRAEEGALLGFDALSDGTALTLALAEDGREADDAIGPVLRALSELRWTCAGRDVREAAAAAAELCASVVVARLGPEEAEFAAAGDLHPYLWHSGLAAPLTGAGAAVRSGAARLDPGDIVLVPSLGARALVGFSGDALTSEMERIARLAEPAGMAGAFTEIVSEWKTEGLVPDRLDVVVLGARRL